MVSSALGDLKNSLHFREPFMPKPNCSSGSACQTCDHHGAVIEPDLRTGSDKLTPTSKNVVDCENHTGLFSYIIPADMFRLNLHKNTVSDLSIDMSPRLNNSIYDVTSVSINTTEGTYNNTDDYTDDYVYEYSSSDSPPPLGEILPVSLVYGITLIVGVVGNLLVIVAVARDRRLRSITNIFLTSLACADLALLCFCVPVKCIAFFSFSWTFGFFLCKAVHYFQIVAMVCSVMTLTMMSIERNIAIRSPLRSKRICTRSRARIAVVLLWSGSVVLALPILLGQKHKLVGDFRKAYWCTKEWEKPVYSILFESYMLVLLFLMPVWIMVISYTTICMELSRGTKFRRQATTTPSTTTYRSHSSHMSRFCGRSIKQSNKGSCRDGRMQDRNKERMETEKIKVIRMLIVVVVLFAVCWGPILINNLLVALGVLDKLHMGHLKPLRQAIFLMSYLNSSLNPLVYGFMSRHFRRGFREAICVCCSSNGGRDGNNRLRRGRSSNNTKSYYASDSRSSTVRTGTIRLSPVAEQRTVVYDELEDTDLGNTRFGRKVWASTDNSAQRLHDSKDFA